VLCISWTNKGFNIINMHSATKKINGLLFNSVQISVDASWKCSPTLVIIVTVRSILHTEYYISSNVFCHLCFTLSLMYGKLFERFLQQIDTN